MHEDVITRLPPVNRGRDGRSSSISGALQQNTGPRSVVVRYPLHPLAGRTLWIRERRRGPSPTYRLSTSEGESFELPVWMTEETAARLRFVDSPRLSVAALRELVALTRKGLESAGDQEEILPSDQAKEGSHETEPTPTGVDTRSSPQKNSACRVCRRRFTKRAAKRSPGCSCVLWAEPARPTRSRRCTVNPADQHRIAPRHLERSAIVYIRQSDPQQVREHTESTRSNAASARKRSTSDGPIQRSSKTTWGSRRVASQIDLGSNGCSRR